MRAETYEQLSVTLWDHHDNPWEYEFKGTWLVEPDDWHTRAFDPVDDKWDAGAYYGVALLPDGRFLTYVAHCNGGWAPHLEVMNDLDAGLPPNILGIAKAALDD
jgi:hypothetical protein